MVGVQFEDYTVIAEQGNEYRVTFGFNSFLLYTKSVIL